MNRSWIVALGLVGAWIVAATPATAQPRRDAIAELRQEVQALQAQLGMMLGRDGQRDVQLADVARRLDELARQTAAAELLHRADAEGLVTAARRELAQAIAALRAELGAMDVAAPTQVDHVGGFVWTTEDEAYQLRIAGYLQARLEASVRAERGAETRTEAGFALRRARVILEGTGDADVGFRIMADLALPALVDAYLEWVVGPLGLRVGRDRVPSTRSSLTPEHRLAFAEPNLLADAHRWDRDVGLHLRFRTRRAAAYVTIGNGGPDAALEGSPLAAFRNELALTGPLPDAGAGDLVNTWRTAIAIGASVVMDPVLAPSAVGAIPVINDGDGDGAADRIVAVGAGLDLTLRRRGLELALEGMVRYEHWGDLLAVNPALAMALGSSDPSRVAVAGSIEVTKAVRGVMMFGARVAYGGVPVLSMHGPSAIPPGERALEIGVSAAIYRGGTRFVGLTHRAMTFTDRRDGADPVVQHHLVLELQGTL